ncbi:MAG: ATP-binding protein [bacterium]|nr:ATP-binding protein [bacterium]
MPELVVGVVPRGEDYFGQDQLIETIWSHLKKDNVLLVAPRRFGKTGAMYRLLDDHRDRFVPIYIDVEYTMSAADFMVELIAHLIKQKYFLRIVKSIWKETKEFGNFIRDIPKGIDFGGLKVEIREKTDVQQKWLQYGERIGGMLAKEKNPLLLIIDEFPIMVNYILKRDKKEAEQFLHWFRSLRTAPDTSTRFVIGGSINLVSTLDHHGMVDTINDISVVKLPPFSIKTARQFIKEIFATRRIEPTGEVTDTIIQLIGKPVPYLLAVLLSAIFDRARVLDHEITPEIVKETFDEDLLGGSTSAVFLHYRTRIDQLQYYSDDESRAAKTILGTLSRSDGPVKRDTLYHIFRDTCNLEERVEAREGFMRLMNKLDNDFYLTAENDNYTFYSRVLKVWWKTHYGWY